MRDRTSNFYKVILGLKFWPNFEFSIFFLAEKFQGKIFLCSISRKKEKRIFFFIFNFQETQIDDEKNVILLLPNVRKVRRTLGPNFEPLRTSLFCPKPNSEPPEHHKKPNSSRTPDSSFHLYTKCNQR